jgi:hypothetical protein
MAWLEPIDPKDARRYALALRDQASDRSEEIAERIAELAREARHVVEPRLHKATELVRREAPVFAEAAMKQAGRAARAAKADPVPVVVGAVGLLLVASLVFGRRRT